MYLGKKHTEKSIMINGQHVEDVLPGFLTCGVSGRESLAADFDEEEMHSRAGVIVRNRRFPARTIKVKFLLDSIADGGISKKIRKLNEILNIEDAQVIFADEPDVYFVGSPSFGGEVTRTDKVATGEFEIRCFKPFRYGVKEIEVQGENGLLTASYKGSLPAAPRFVVDFAKTKKSESGFIVFCDTHGHMIQAGNPHEEDAKPGVASETLIDTPCVGTGGSWIATAGKPFAGINYQGEWEQGVDASGAKYITPKNFGGPAVPNPWPVDLTGPSYCIDIPADSDGQSGASDFNVEYQVEWFTKSGDPRCLGTHLCAVEDESGRIIAGVELKKWYSGTKGWANVIIDGGHRLSFNIEFEATENSPHFGSNGSKTISFHKNGAYVGIRAAGEAWSVYWEEFRNVKGTKLVFAATKYRGAGDSYPAMHCRTYGVRFRKNGVNVLEDIPNVFAAGDKLIADCRDGSLTVNSVPRPELGALGNDWETLRLEKGENRIAYAYSNFTENAPQVKMLYREVYL